MPRYDSGMDVAVEFSAHVDDAGDLLADAHAYEAAGAAALLVSDDGSGASAAVLGALAVTCLRARIGPLELERTGWPMERIDDAIASLDRLSRGRLVLLSRVPLQVGERALDGMVVDDPPESLRSRPLPQWVRVPFPASKTEWKQTRAAYEAAGAAALILQRDPRLLDLLRNPDVLDDRADLNIAVG